MGFRLMNVYVKAAVAVVALVAGTRQAHAQFRIPRSVIEISNIEEAQETARKRKLPIAVLYSDHTSSCGIVKNYSETIIRELRNSAVLVYLPRSAARPDFLKAAFQSGKFIPKLAVFDAELETVIHELTYEEMKEKGLSKSLNAVKNVIREHRRK